MSRLKVFYIVIGIAALFYRACSGLGLKVLPNPSQITTSEGETVSLVCSANERPSICLWRTPYQAIYTVGGGRVWEKGRLSTAPGAGPHQCGLVIKGIQARDKGRWQCEVGAVVGGEFSTTTANTVISIITRIPGREVTSAPSKLFGLEGDIITLPCLGTGDSSSFLGCKWQAPYGQSFSLHLGEYAERGRLQVGAGCRLKVNNLHSRDEGDWSCLVGDQAVVQRITSLNIDTPLKLSAPTSILQQADERATLVCHANKVYESCEWETPYGRTVSFSSNHREVKQKI